MLVNNVLHPALMVYQVATDYAQRGLSSQDAKPTMDKVLLENDVSGLSVAERVKLLTNSASKHARKYAQEIDFTPHLTNKRLRAKFTQAVVWLTYAQEVLRYQVLRSDKERYSQAV